MKAIDPKIARQGILINEIKRAERNRQKWSLFFEPLRKQVTDRCGSGLYQRGVDPVADAVLDKLNDSRDNLHAMRKELNSLR